MPKVKYLRGDCLYFLPKMKDNSIDSIVTDPPYGLVFMGKGWDRGVPGVMYWKEMLRVLKPGGHLLSFGGTRTYHRMATAIEDAGFEIRDCIMWLYGTGFPKSQDVSKAIDKQAGAKREVIRFRSYEVVEDQNTYGSGINSSKPRSESSEITSPATDEAQEWEGWGTALKPACEPIVVARKPLAEKTIAKNVLKHRTGAMNIDGTRVKLVGKNDPRLGGKGTWGTSQMAKNVYEGGYAGERVGSSERGRWPANIILDPEAAEILDEQSGIQKDGVAVRHRGVQGGTIGPPGNKPKGTPDMGYGGEGGASRFFYVAKANKKERNLGEANNNHPTVKPVMLMQYLVRLVTPPSGVVLDPFMGSGTTGVAAIKEGMRFIGIEKDRDYMLIAKQRIKQEQCRK